MSTSTKKAKAKGTKKAPAKALGQGKLIKLSLDDICIDGGTQSRAKIDQATVDEYCLAMLAGAQFPPVVVFFDGTKYWLADGFHRHYAKNETWCPAHTAPILILANVREGTKQDALKYSLAANDVHGLRRTNDDKRRAVELALAEFPRYSDRKIAELCNVGHSLIASVRATIQEPAQLAENPVAIPPESPFVHPVTGPILYRQLQTLAAEKAAGLPPLSVLKRIGKDGKERAMPKRSAATTESGEPQNTPAVIAGQAQTGENDQSGQTTPTTSNGQGWAEADSPKLRKLKEDWNGATRLDQEAFLAYVISTEGANVIALFALVWQKLNGGDRQRCAGAIQAAMSKSQPAQ